MKRNAFKVADQRGLTLLEVLIASSVFMIGFTIMVFLLNQMQGRFSSKEMVLAYQLAKEEMEKTLAANNFESLTKTEIRSKISFFVERQITDNDGLVSIRINVTRAKTGKKLVTLYDEIFSR
ncbi:hypothetical protein TRIP_C60013 [Candidatus Zixiibacteriota bacterium]|nr:hypothetical protein TRIP_C60013 [candidate division Zixibacteria bacterium]